MMDLLTYRDCFEEMPLPIPAMFGQGNEVIRVAANVLFSFYASRDPAYAVAITSLGIACYQEAAFGVKSPSSHAQRRIMGTRNGIRDL
jgi:hypothetical protein